MATTWLTLSEVADQVRRTQKALRTDLELGEFPAPDRFEEDQGPRWNAKYANYESRRTPVTDRKPTRDESIMHLYDEVLYWIMQHGDALIPQAAVGRQTRVGNPKPYPLGARVATLRNAYMHGRLEPKYSKLFDKLPGWVWDYWASVWNERLDDVLLRFPDELTRADRAWLATQKLRMNDAKFRPEWRDRLNAVPGLFDTSTKSKAGEFVEAVQVWLAQNPGATTFSMPYAAKVEIDGITYPVGRRATYYRRRYRALEGPSKQPLPDEDIALIEKLPGWTWENPSELMGVSRGPKAT